ncbi:hypothetical protein ACWGI9_41020 [Streptomyces sp. NPDC054833]
MRALDRGGAAEQGLQAAVLTCPPRLMVKCWPESIQPRPRCESWIDRASAKACACEPSWTLGLSV